MNMKEVLIFSHSYYPKHIGGAEVAIKEITDRIDASEIAFHMVTNRYDSTLPKVEQVGNVLVHRIGLTTREPEMGDLKKFPLHLNKFLFQFLAAWKAFWLHRTYSYDGTWAMMAHSCGVPAALFKMLHPRVPYLLTLQEGDPPAHIEKKMRPLWPLFTRSFTKADRVQAISTFLANWARSRGFTGELSVIPNAVNTEHFTQEYAAEDLARVREEIGKKDGETWLVTTSRLVHKNGIDDVIRALSHTPESVHFLIYGTGPDEDMLRELAKEVGVQERVHFGGFIQHENMPKYLKACDVFIRPSRSEGMGNSFVEAMAAELPVIATQAGGIADFLFDAKRDPDTETTGWAVDADAPEQIAAAVKGIIAHPEQVTRVVANAKALALEKYDWDLIATDMHEQVFTPLLARQ